MTPKVITAKRMLTSMIFRRNSSIKPSKFEHQNFDTPKSNCGKKHVEIDYFSSKFAHHEFDTPVVIVSRRTPEARDAGFPYPSKAGASIPKKDSIPGYRKSMRQLNALLSQNTTKQFQFSSIIIELRTQTVKTNTFIFRVGFDRAP